MFHKFPFFSLLYFLSFSFFSTIFIVYSIVIFFYFLQFYCELNFLHRGDSFCFLHFHCLVCLQFHIPYCLLASSESLSLPISRISGRRPPSRSLSISAQLLFLGSAQTLVRRLAQLLSSSQSLASFAQLLFSGSSRSLFLDACPYALSGVFVFYQSMSG